MAPRTASGNTIVRLAVRATALASLFALGAAPSWADARSTLPGQPPRQIDLFKPPHEDLRIRWSANVHEEGGEFLISRQHLGGETVEVARVRSRIGGRYEVAEHGPSGSWVYKLRYRDRRGREHVLITIRLNVERIDAGQGIPTGAAHGQPAAIRTAAVLPMPAPGDWPLPAGAETTLGGPDRWPPTPPP